MKNRLFENSVFCCGSLPKISTQKLRAIILGSYFLATCLLAILLISAQFNLAKAEIVELQKEEKTFGEWKVFCETDLMLNISHCKVAAKFFDNSAVISIEPTQKFYSQFFVAIPQIQNGSFVKFRVDQQDLILSKTISHKDFGLIPLEEAQKQNLFQQMKNGEFLYLRFNVRGQENEITARVNLRDLRSALSYYNIKSQNN